MFLVTERDVFFNDRRKSSVVLISLSQHRGVLLHQETLIGAALWGKHIHANF